MFNYHRPSDFSPVLNLMLHSTEKSNYCSKTKKQKRQELKVMQWSKCITYIFAFLCIWLFKKQIHNKGHGSDSFVVPSDGESILIYFYGSQALRCQDGLWDCSALAVSCYGQQSFTFTFFVASCVTFISKTTKFNAIVKKKL